MKINTSYNKYIVFAGDDMYPADEQNIIDRELIDVYNTMGISLDANGDII